MYKCPKCSYSTTTLTIYREYRPYGEVGAYENMTNYNCPCCGEELEIVDDYYNDDEV